MAGFRYRFRYIVQIYNNADGFKESAGGILYKTSNKICSCRKANWFFRSIHSGIVAAFTYPRRFAIKLTDSHSAAHQPLWLRK